MHYVVWLSSSSISNAINSYGYWTGKDYVVNGELFPVTDYEVTDRTKIYTSKGRAERGLLACLDKGYAYVSCGEVREVREISNVNNTDIRHVKRVV